ncbi:MAG TPA: M20/M25/M40 family metallo-hydrolase, partial [Solirubrobacteraceae bacterium]|nr:M20/M25/M40 family metallo-hydrolase [Solirubrobacteraceae bacterium]
LQRIADRSGGNRAAGTDGDRRTAEYIERTLRDAGWRVQRQEVGFPYFEQRSEPRLASLRPGREVRAAEYSGAGDLRARVRRLRGRGCSVADFAGLPKGDVALVDRGTCFFSVKARNAERAGAGAIVVSDVSGRTPVSATLLRPGVGIPVLIVTAAAAERIEGRTVRVRVDAISDRRTTTNVIAETKPGRGRWTMAGAHLDSVTAGPGINDNGTGIAALLAIAERLRDERPGLRFGFWGAEELALYGSRHYVRELPAAERRQIAAYVNLDMVGSPNGRVEVYDRDDRIERTLREAIPGSEGEVPLTGASDHAPFERAGIPVGGIFTGAAERGRRPGPADRCYHRRCDTLRNVDRPLLQRMTDAAERGLKRLAR